jgi:hypothetical protein
MTDPYKQITCLRCRKGATVAIQSRAGLCYKCSSAHLAEGIRASSKITRAIKRGQLEPAKTHLCVDCGSQARDWEHRDYTKPLAVVPVCRPCNQRRPTAFDSVYRPA